MALYPYNFNIGQLIATNVAGTSVDRGFIAHFEVTDPAAASATAVLALTALTTEVQTITASSSLTDPDYPRALQIDGSTSDATGNVVVTGTNYADASINETIALNGTTAVNGNKAFKTVTSIQLPVKVGSESVSVGTNDKLGLPYTLTRNTVLSSFLDNTLEGTAATVAVNASNVESNTVDLNSALDGNKVDVYLIV